MTYSNYSGGSSGGSSSSDATSYNSNTDYTASESTESTESSASTGNYTIEAESFRFSATQLKYSPVHRTDDVHNRFYNVDLTEYVIEPLEGGPPGENVYGDPDPDIQDLLDQLLQAIKDEIEDRLPDQIVDKLVTIKECLGDNYNLKDSVQEYNDWEQNRDEDGNLLPQFPNCPDEQFVYPSGWEYEAERLLSLLVVPDGVFKMRSAKVGPPDKTATAESHNPAGFLTCLKMRDNDSQGP